MYYFMHLLEANSSCMYYISYYIDLAHMYNTCRMLQTNLICFIRIEHYWIYMQWWDLPLHNNYDKFGTYSDPAPFSRHAFCCQDVKTNVKTRGKIGQDCVKTGANCQDWWSWQPFCIDSMRLFEYNNVHTYKEIQHI